MAVESTEAVNRIVDSYHAAFLHRPREPVTSDTWVTMLHSPDGSPTEVALGILASPEYEHDLVKTTTSS